MEVKTETKKCIDCGKEVPESEGVSLLRGTQFACKDCADKHKAETKDKEVCEFC